MTPDVVLHCECPVLAARLGCHKVPFTKFFFEDYLTCRGPKWPTIWIIARGGEVWGWPIDKELIK